jgi:hypothetical protein
MPALNYPGRGAQRKKEESEAMLQRIHQLENDPGRALSRARRIEKAAHRIEQAAHQLAKELDVAYKNVFPGLEENRLAILRARLSRKDR